MSASAVVGHNAAARLTARRVPVARRNLAADRRRLVVSTSGVGLAVMLILLLDGMWSGLKAQSHLYTDHAGADLYVLQSGTEDLSDGGVVPMSVVDRVRATPGIEWASPVRGTSVVLELHGRKLVVFLIGTAPGDHGGAWSIGQGRNVRADDEIVIDSVTAERDGIHLGDSLALMGRSLRVVGLAHTSGFMTTYLFVTHAATDQLFAAEGTTSFVLVGTSDPGAARQRLVAAGFNALTAKQVAANAQRITSRIMSGPLALMVMVGFATGTLVIALTAYTTIVDRRRDYAIVKALGARRGRLVAMALAQTFMLALLGLVVGLVFFLGGRALIEWTKPNFEILLTTGAVVRAGAAAVVMACLAAIVPARRLSRLDPTTAYRES